MLLLSCCGWVRVTVSTSVLMLADRPPRRCAQGLACRGAGGWLDSAASAGAACASSQDGQMTIRGMLKVTRCGLQTC